MKEAIQKAIEGGWDESRADIIHGPTNIVIASEDKAFLDPLFWQALGKAMGWSIYAVCATCGETNCTRPIHHEGYSQEYIFHWHRFIDHIAEGKDAESFFTALTNKK